MSNWHPSVEKYLVNEQYSEIAHFYEQLLAENPQEISNYWYLGLAYLLQGKEEEAQTTWFYVFSQLHEQESDIFAQDLINILENEAQRQGKNEDNSLSLLIRHHLREISPLDVHNLLHLVNLEVKLNNFQTEKLQEWQVIKLIQENHQNNINLKLLAETLKLVLQIPNPESVELAKASLIGTNGDKNIISIIASAANYMSRKKGFLLYGANLMEICLGYEPDNLSFLQDLLLFYLTNEDYEKSEEVVLNFRQKCHTLPQKILNYNWEISLNLKSCNWIKAISLTENYQQLLSQLLVENPPILDKFMRDFLPIPTQPLLYLEDNPQKNRHLINQISAFFQRQCQTTFSCPTSYLPSAGDRHQRKLKIGYIGHTMKAHSVGWLMRWLINYHNREKFDIALYFVNQEEDFVTKKYFQEKAEIARHLSLDVNMMVTQIEKDEIDILIDIDSFTHNVTSTVMALKPVPIQVSWLGMDTTGIPAIDYFIADPYVLPEDAQEYYQEKIWRLPHTYIAVDGFEVDIPNLNRKELEIPQQAVVYFNAQHDLKLNPHAIYLQMKILKSVPDSYLLVKNSGKNVAKLFTEIAKAEGVEPSRLRFIPKVATESLHRANLEIADVVLDTYPYNGATTTLETLWMGIPIVTRVGEQFAARNSYSFMINVGVTEGIAWSDEEYVEWGVRLGRDEQLREQVAWKLRQSRHTSPLWNGKQFAREMEKAYQQMWQIYLES
jgi:predicted O-linked N-acetylglucosamine transferase (SPINDLY family)